MEKDFRVDNFLSQVNLKMRNVNAKKNNTFQKIVVYFILFFVFLLIIGANVLLVLSYIFPSIWPFFKEIYLPFLGIILLVGIMYLYIDANINNKIAKFGNKCIVSKKIINEDFKVGYMYREKPVKNTQDSGWRFLAGNEDEEYIKDNNNFIICDFEEIKKHDYSVKDYLNFKINTKLVKIDEQSFIRDDGKVDIYVSENIKELYKNNFEKINEIKIIPYSSVNDLKFGVNRDKVWKKFGKPENSFLKSKNAEVETDVYKNFHIYYDNNYNFEAIEVFNNIDIYYDNNKLSKKYSEILEYYKQRFTDIEEYEYGFTTKKGSIGVYKENDDDSIDVILFGKKDYYK